MAIVTFYNGDPKDAPKTTMPAHLGANAIITCKDRLLLEKRLVNSKPLPVWTHSTRMPRRAYHFTSFLRKSAEE